MGGVTNSAPWQPLSARLAGKPVQDALFEGVPPHLEMPLRSWLVAALKDHGVAMRVGVRLRRPISGNPANELVSAGREEMLDVIDAILYISRETESIRLRETLDGLLDEGGSAYRVSDDLLSLERRVDSSVAEAVRATRATATKAGRRAAATHLAEAWGKAYGLKPDPGIAYREAVRAVEAAAIPLVLPADPLPTLGKVLASLRQGAAKWELVIADKNGAPAPIDSVIAMIGLLWCGHRDRHAGGPTTAPITQPAAEAAVHLAATLVHWFSSGAVRRKPGP